MECIGGKMVEVISFFPLLFQFKRSLRFYIEENQIRIVLVFSWFFVQPFFARLTGKYWEKKVKEGKEDFLRDIFRKQLFNY